MHEYTMHMYRYLIIDCMYIVRVLEMHSKLRVYTHNFFLTGLKEVGEGEGGEE